MSFIASLKFPSAPDVLPPQPYHKYPDLALFKRIWSPAAFQGKNLWTWSYRVTTAGVMLVVLLVDAVIGNLYRYTFGNLKVCLNNERFYRKQKVYIAERNCVLKNYGKVALGLIGVGAIVYFLKGSFGFVPVEKEVKTSHPIEVEKLFERDPEASHPMEEPSFSLIPKFFSTRLALLVGVVAIPSFYCLSKMGHYFTSPVERARVVENPNDSFASSFLKDSFSFFPIEKEVRTSHPIKPEVEEFYSPQRNATARVSPAEASNLIRLFHQIPLEKPTLTGSQKAQKAQIRTWMQAHTEALSSITSLDLKQQDLTAVPQEIRYFTSLRSLDLRNNRISSLDNVTFPISLEELNFSYNRISSLDNVTFSASLQRLVFHHNQIISLVNVTFPPSLRWLNLSHNRITSLADVTLPASLQVLVLGNNQITSPVNVTFPASLRWMNLSHNRITSLTNVALPASLQVLVLGIKQIRLDNVIFPPSLRWL